MRIGMNPQKQEKKIELQFQHRLIILVYVPEKEGYYQNIFEVFKLCLESAITTINKKCAITVVNNGSKKEVVDYINQKYANKEIDSVIHHNINIGKMDAIIGAARASREPIITLSDVDVLFKYGWQQEVERNFKAFKNLGTVSPMAVKSAFRISNVSTQQQIIFKQLSFTLEPIPENTEDYNLYLKSLNWDITAEKNAMWPVVKANNQKAILGCAHQVLSINREIFFKTVPTKPSLTLIGQNSVYNYADGPIDFAGGLRLSTYHNYAYHMGNTVEDWMVKVQENNIEKAKSQPGEIIDFKLTFKPSKHYPFWFKMKEKIICKLFDLLYTSKIKRSI
jgi:hypothetical protein